MLTKELYCLLGFTGLRRIGMGEDDCSCFLYLIVIKLAKVFHIHSTFVDVGNGGIAIYFRIVAFDLSDGTNVECI